MSFCRVGTQSDIHAFEEGTGRFVVQVARNRHAPLTEAQEDAMTAAQMWDWLQANSQPIGGRCDGEQFELATPGALVDKLRDLLVLGYQVEPETWANIERDYPGVVPGALLPTVRRHAPMPH